MVELLQKAADDSSHQATADTLSPFNAVVLTRAPQCLLMLEMVLWPKAYERALAAAPRSASSGLTPDFGFNHAL
jgi:hypothetical protein